MHLPASKALSLALAIHELATNALKYGALSQDGGTVAIDWSVAEGELILRWIERGGPPVSTPQTRGFGSRLIERALAAEFRGKARIEFPEEGVLFELVAPLEAASTLATA